MAHPDGSAVGSVYEIQFQGQLEGAWSAWLNGLLHAAELRTSDSRVTCLTVQVADQAALRGTLNRLWDLNLKLIGVRMIETTPAKETDHGC